MKLLNYPFVVIYRFYLKIGEREVPHYFSSVFISAYQGFYIVSILDILNVSRKGKAEYLDFFLFAILLAINFFRFLYKSKYKKILDKTDLKEGGFKSIIVIILVVLIFLTGLGIWMYTAYLIRNNALG
ncbi:MAG: hypothetical protein GF364_04065 [Candidatus Lokiarchaeota archaeon]|nr:hypothetical protein [Candidatus Lokiarchaeota archaeon]